jgi:mycothiol system anti-sigma-R factor
MNPSTPNPFIVNGKKSSCLEMLQVILDGEATDEQTKYFAQHMDICLPCFKGYELDMTIKQLVKSKCCGDGAPSDLIEQIRITISQKIS